MYRDGHKFNPVPHYFEVMLMFIQINSLYSLEDVSPVY